MTNTLPRIEFVLISWQRLLFLKFNDVCLLGVLEQKQDVPKLKSLLILVNIYRV